MRINSRKVYLFFFLSIFAIFFSSIGIFNSSSSSLSNEEAISNSTFDSYDTNSKSLVEDMQSSANSIKGLNSSDLNFPHDVLKLTGIVVAYQKPIALVSYKNISGKIVEGDKGGNTTSLLPENVILEKIDPNKSRLILSYGNRKFVQYLYPQNTLEIIN